MTASGGQRPLDIVMFGLSITSSWGNGHATTYRALVHALHRCGHRVRFFERNVPWYEGHRDLAAPTYCEVQLYADIGELDRSVTELARADVVMIGSYVPEGRRLAEWLLPRVGGIKVFYDIDTPITVGKLANDTCEYLDRERVPDFDLYLSFSGGPILERLHAHFGASRPRPFYCSVEPSEYFPIAGAAKRYALGYLGTYSADRQPALERLLLQPARQWPEGLFYVAGAQYPEALQWPANVERTQHLPPAMHRNFYNQQRCTLNVTRAEMIASGYSPSVRLFEAAACGVPIISDPWAGLDELFEPGREILIAHSTGEVLEILQDSPETELQKIGSRARQRVLAHHTAEHRAQELERHLQELQREWPDWSASQSHRAGVVAV